MEFLVNLWKIVTKKESIVSIANTILSHGMQKTQKGVIFLISNLNIIPVFSLEKIQEMSVKVLLKKRHE